MTRVHRWLVSDWGNKHGGEQPLMCRPCSCLERFDFNFLEIEKAWPPLLVVRCFCMLFLVFLCAFYMFGFCKR